MHWDKTRYVLNTKIHMEHQAVCCFNIQIYNGHLLGVVDNKREPTKTGLNSWHIEMLHMQIKTYQSSAHHLDRGKRLIRANYTLIKAVKSTFLCKLQADQTCTCKKMTVKLVPGS